MSKKLWVKCIEAEGTKILKNDVKYLVKVMGDKAKVIISENNPNYVYGNIVNKDRFTQIV